MTKRFGKYSLIQFVLVVLILTATAAMDRPAPVGVSFRLPFEPVKNELIENLKVTSTDTAHNIITDPWNSLAKLFERMQALREGADSTVSILHIGDSHIQAGFLTNRIRKHIQRDFGNAGRGIIIPFKLAGMNEPSDYYIRTGNSTDISKATDALRGLATGPTGIKATTIGRYTTFNIWSKEPFNLITAIHSVRAPALAADPDSLMLDTYCTIDNTSNSTRITFDRMLDTVRLTGRLCEDFDDPTFFGFSLSNGHPGILYHAVGVNGAAFDHFINNTDVAAGGLSALDPDLIIISLGTNNCYGGNFRSAYFREVAEKFIVGIAESYPRSAILVTTPMESGRRSGRNNYTVNDNIRVAGDILKEIADEKELASWDLYNASGGKGSNGQWLDAGLMSRDRIHLTEAGYLHQADMFYSALINYFNRYHLDRDD